MYLADTSRGVSQGSSTHPGSALTPLSSPLTPTTPSNSSLPAHQQHQHQTQRRILTLVHAGTPPNPPAAGGNGGSGGPHSTCPKPLFTVAVKEKEVVLTMASFAVTKLAYVRLTKMFRDEYLAKTGVDVKFRLTFAGSGVQARAVIDGLPADFLALALVLDIEKVAEAGLIDLSWRSRYPNNSIVCETTVAFVVRQGNPKNIRTWDDLIREDVGVVVANPKTAGVARWIVLALWGHLMKKGDAAARQYVTRVFENVVVQPRDAREASDVFYKQKVGDVLLTYENEVILTNQVYGEKALPYTVPSPNIRIECPLSLVDAVLDTREPAARRAADEFAKFLFTPPAQKEFGELGFRINPKLSKELARAQTMPPAKLWTVEKELGGWEQAQAKFFDAGAILDQIQIEVGRKKLQQRQMAVAAGRA